MLRPGPGASVDLDLHVVPRASRSRVIGVFADRLKVQLAAPPVDGAANEALLELFAAQLRLSRGALELVRGATGKRKTLRIHQLSLAEIADRLALPRPPGALTPALALLVLAVSCAEVVDVPITLLIPEDASDLDRADNAALVLDPDGQLFQYDVDGLDFSLSIELPLDEAQRTLTLYLARGDELLAWGRSAPFILGGEDERLALLLGRPGALSTFPGAITSPRADLLLARAHGRGALLLDPDGVAYFLGERSLNLRAAAELVVDGDLPEPSDGVLVGAADGAVLRIAFSEPLRGWRFDPGADAWSPLAIAGASPGDRRGAAALVDADARVLVILGGGESTTIAELDLTADTSGSHPLRLLDSPHLDAPRAGARAAWIPREAGGGVLLFGGHADDLAPAYFAPEAGEGAPLGPPGPWHGAACTRLDLDVAAAAAVRVLCLGGVRGGEPTADALLITLPPAADSSAPIAEELPGWLPQAIPEPQLFADPRALYAQGAGHWLRIDRADLTRTQTPSAARRDRGGHSVLLGTGVTLLIGGADAEGAPVDRWQVFMPAL
ncbi:MAG: DUF167 domain-containing protein [Nannocystis sp.]|nr:DUF167 domain-containing protein [Nannocystis sp.]